MTELFSDMEGKKKKPQDLELYYPLFFISC